MEIPGYKLSREIETGKVCTNYNALDVEHGKTVIVKAFNEKLSRNQIFQRHFGKVTERLVDQTLGNNVHYLDAIVNDDACVVVTNYCPRSVHEQGSLPEFSEDKALDIGKQLATSLSQLHNLGVVHGGVELSNINFRDSDEVVLGTVAFHRTIPGDDAHLVSLSMSEAAYIAPEARKTGLTASSDFFSLGVVLYELLEGKKPFKAGSLAELEQQKQAGSYQPLNDALAHLKPLFNGLLAPKPESRIASDEQFISILDACRMGATGRSRKAAPKQAGAKSAHVKTQPKPVAPATQKGKSPLLLAGLAAVVIGAAVVFFMMSGKEETPQQAVNKKPSSQVASKPETISDGPSVIEQPGEQTEANGFYKNAMALAQKGDYEAALQAVDHALSIEKYYEPAEKLKSEIERELKIRSFVTTAEKQFEDEKLIMPPGDNAFETYQRIINLAPGGDNRADTGIEKIADRYLVLAKEQVNKGKLNDAKEAIARGLIAKSDYQPLIELESTLASEQEIRNRKQAAARAEESRRQLREQQRQQEEKAKALAAKRRAEQRRAERRRTEQRREEQRTAELTEQRRLERQRITQEEAAKRQAAAAQQTELAAREAEITRRLSTAEQQLARQPLSWLRLDTAKNEYRSLVKIAANDSRVSGLRRKIVDSHINLANRQKSAANLSESMETVNRGLALDGANKKLLALKKELGKAIKKSNKKKNDLPVIGTF